MLILVHQVWGNFTLDAEGDVLFCFFFFLLQRGLSANKGRVTFRQWYSCLKELRSLVPSGLPFLALTATASKTTKKDIFEVLEFKSPCEVVESPDRKNIVYSTQLMEKGRDVTDYFWWLLSDIKDKGATTDRVLIYCQSLKQCTQLYQVFLSELKSKNFVGENPNPKERLVEMLHSKTPKTVKDTILESFTKNDGHVRVLFATVAFGMGVNAKGVKTIIHVGPSKNLEAYVQESGRCGRGGEQSRAIVLFTNKMCVFCDKDIKDYVVSEECRRNILENFLMLVVTPSHRIGCFTIVVIIVPKNVIVTRQVVSQLSSYLLAQHLMNCCYPGEGMSVLHRKTICKLN